MIKWTDLLCVDDCEIRSKDLEMNKNEFIQTTSRNDLVYYILFEF